MKLVYGYGRSVNKVVKGIKVVVGVSFCCSIGLDVGIGVGSVVDSACGITFMVDYESNMGYYGVWFSCFNDGKIVGWFLDESLEQNDVHLIHLYEISRNVNYGARIYVGIYIGI